MLARFGLGGRTEDVQDPLAPPQGQPEDVIVRYDKASHMEFGCIHRGVPGDNVSKGQLRRDLGTTYYWSGSFCRDYIFFVANWHPLFGMWCSHPVHPWSKRHRFATFVFSCAITMLPASVIVYMGETSDGGVAAQIVSKAVILLWITLPVMIWETMLYFINTADMHFEDRGYRACNFLVYGLRCVRELWTCIALAAALVVATISLVIIAVSGAPAKRLLRPLLVSRVQSWVLWFPLWFFLPFMGFLHGWTMEKRSLAEPSA